MGESADHGSPNVSKNYGRSRMNCKIFTTAAAVLVLSSSVGFAADAPKKDPGRKLFMTKTCLACHGKDGRKAMLDYPNLAGQDAKYLERQVNDILSNVRIGSPDATGHPRTDGMRGALIRAVDNKPSVSKAEIKQIAVWLSKQKPADLKAPKEPLDPASVKAGKDLFKKRCRTCHGPEGKRPLKGNPYLAGQKRNYLFVQLQDIRSKDRKSKRVAAMYGIVKRLTDEDFANLADYLSQVDRNAGK